MVGALDQQKKNPPMSKWRSASRGPGVKTMGPSTAHKKKIEKKKTTFGSGKGEGPFEGRDPEIPNGKKRVACTRQQRTR